MSADRSSSIIGPLGTRGQPHEVRIVDETAIILMSAGFRRLVKERSAFAWTLSIVMVVVYLGFIGLVAFAHELMATKIGDSQISLGIVLGLAVIVFAFALTGIYVARANSRFDGLTRDLDKDLHR